MRGRYDSVSSFLAMTYSLLKVADRLSDMNCLLSNSIPLKLALTDLNMASSQLIPFTFLILPELNKPM